MQFHHDSVGHPGAGRMIDTLAQKYWWQGYSDDTKDYVNQCKFCLRRKPSRGGLFQYKNIQDRIARLKGHTWILRDHSQKQKRAPDIF